MFERFSGWWPDPNVAAMDLAGLWLLGVVCFAHGFRWRWMLLVSGLAVCVSAWLLVATGSRAGLLAALVGWGFVLATRSLPWRSVLAALAPLSVALLLQGALLTRGAAAFTGDRSVINRLDLWRAVAGLIAEHPWQGLGLEQGMAVIDAWALPLDLSGSYATALNDALTLGLAYGVVPLWILLLLLCAVGLTVLRVRQNLVVLAAYAVLLTRIIAGQFQAHAWVWERGLITLGIALIALAFAVRAQGGVAAWFQQHDRSWAWAVLWATGAILGLWIWGYMQMQARPWRVELRQGLAVVHAGPVQPQQPGVVLVPPATWHARQVAKRWVRVCAGAEWPVAVAGVHNQFPSALRAVVVGSGQEASTLLQQQAQGQLSVPLLALSAQSLWRPGSQPSAFPALLLRGSSDVIAADPKLLQEALRASHGGLGQCLTVPGSWVSMEQALAYLPQLLVPVASVPHEH